MNEFKIAYIVPMGSGLDTFVYREVNELYKRGRKIILYATKYKKNDVFSPKKEWPYRTLTIKQLVLRSPALILKLLLHPRLLVDALANKAFVDLVFALDFSPSIKKNSAELIHCHHGDHKLFIGYYCKLLTGLPLSVTIHAAEFYTNPNPSMFKKVIKECDRVFPISEKWQERLVHEFGVDRERIRLNRLFVDSSIYKPAQTLKILSVGRFTERKGFQYLLEAADLLRDIDIEYIFVGFGNLDIRKIASEMDLSDRVNVFNKLDQQQLRLLYRSADILCVPSITTNEEGAEGIPVVLMEGMACGLPVVATRCGAIDEIVEDNLVDERSPKQLAEAIRELAANRDMRTQQGRRNREIAVSKYGITNLEKFSENLAEIINESDYG